MALEYFSYRYRIYPTQEQQRQIDHIINGCAVIYDAALDDMIRHHQHTGEVLTPQLDDYRKDHHQHLRGLDPLALSHTLILLKRDFLFQQSKGRYPLFRNSRKKKSYSTTAKQNRVFVKDNLVTLPTVGQVEIVLHRPMPPRPLSVTVIRNASGTYYIVFLFSRPLKRAEQIPATEENTIGLDYSNPKFYVDSNGDSPDHPRFYKEEEKRLEREIAKLRRKQKGSANYEKQRKKIARIYERISNRRKDWLHKESRRLADTYDYVAVEDLDLQAIASTYNLSKNAMDNAYRTFLDMLDYKLSWQGKGLVKINRWVRSSQKCSKCGYLNKSLRLETRFWKCPKCGNDNSRDHNAAINIKNQVLKYLA